MFWTELGFVLHIWFIFCSCYVTNTVWRCNSPDSNLDIVRVLSRTVSESVLHVWFILCSLRYRWCVAMLCGYDSWIYAWYEPWSDAYMHRVWLEWCMSWSHRLFALSKTKTVPWCMMCIKGRFEWCVMYIDYAPMRFLIAARVSYTRLVVDGYCIIGSFIPILMV